MKVINRNPKPFLQSWNTLQRGEVARLYLEDKPTESYYMKVGAKGDGARLTDGGISYNAELLNKSMTFEVFPDAFVAMGGE